MKLFKTEDLRSILIETFSKSDIPQDFESLKLGDIEKWDSFGNFNLLLAIEEALGIRFSMDEMAELKSISQISASIRDKL